MEVINSSACPILRQKAAFTGEKEGFCFLLLWTRFFPTAVWTHRCQWKCTPCCERYVNIDRIYEHIVQNFGGENRRGHFWGCGQTPWPETEPLEQLLPFAFTCLCKASITAMTTIRTQQTDCAWRRAWSQPPSDRPSVKHKLLTKIYKEIRNKV